MTSRAPAGVADVCADFGWIEAELSDGDLDGAGSGLVERRSTMSSSSHAAARTARARGAILWDLDHDSSDVAREYFLGISCWC